MKKISIWILVIILVAGCSQKPVPISYGEDGCHHCKMTIIDNRYGSEMVTEKGKVLKFDAIECMLNYQNESAGGHDKSLFLVTDFSDPGNLIEANSAYYLRSPGLPSPMGMYLTACGSHGAAKAFKDKHSGKIYSWKELKAGFHDFPVLNQSGQ